MLRLILRQQLMPLWQSWASHQQQAFLGRRSRRRLWIRCWGGAKMDRDLSLTPSISSRHVIWSASLRDATSLTVRSPL